MSKTKSSKKTSSSSNSKTNGGPVVNPPEGRFGATITLDPETEPRYQRFTFGVRKARMIVKHFAAIKKFAEDHKED